MGNAVSLLFGEIFKLFLLCGKRSCRNHAL